MAAEDPIDHVSSDRARADKDLRARLQREQEDSDVRWLMGTRRGRRIVWRLLDQSGVFRSSFNHSAMHMAFAEGTRNYGLRLLAQVHELCPDLYPTMMKEATNGRNNDDD